MFVQAVSHPVSAVKAVERNNQVHRVDGAMAGLATAGAKRGGLSLVSHFCHVGGGGEIIMHTATVITRRTDAHILEHRWLKPPGGVAGNWA